MLRSHQTQFRQICVWRLFWWASNLLLYALTPRPCQNMKPLTFFWTSFVKRKHAWCWAISLGSHFEELYRGAGKHVAVSGFTRSSRVSSGEHHFCLWLSLHVKPRGEIKNKTGETFYSCLDEHKLKIRLTLWFTPRRPSDRKVPLWGQRRFSACKSVLWEQLGRGVQRQVKPNWFGFSFQILLSLETFHLYWGRR